jgi:hypothetical protein
MGCLFAVFAGFFPRIAVFLIWIARPTLFAAAFGGSWFWPLLGLIFLPFTTLMWVVLYSPGGVTGWDWFWIFLAVLIDVSSIGGSGYANRDRLPSSYYSDTNP